MANKRYDQFTTATPTGSRITLHADPATGALNKCTLQNILDLTPPQNNAVVLLQAAGSPIIAISLNLNPFWGTSTGSLSSQSLILQLIYLPACTVTGGWFVQIFQGIYTASNYNGMCLYSQAAGTATLIASSTNNGNLFKAAAGSFVQAAFSSTVAVTAGAYYVGTLYSSSAQTASVNLMCQNGTVLGGVNQIMGMTNNNKSQIITPSRTSLPSTLSLTGGGSGSSQPIIMGVY